MTFVEGESVIVVCHTAGATHIDTVAKVYKNGRFKLTKWQSVQFRPDGQIAGERGFYPPHITKIDDPVGCTELARARAHRRLRRLLAALGAVGRRLDEMPADKVMGTLVQLDGVLKSVKEFGWAEWPPEATRKDSGQTT